MSWVLFFDGDCAFCSEAVPWVARFDRRGYVFFSPLQGELAQSMGFSHHAAAGEGTMVVMRESDGAVFTQSDALLELARALGGAWRIFAIAGWIPQSLRDVFYRWFARNRYRFMGKSDMCPVPDPKLRQRLRN